jgi:hypothetical protein
MDLRKPMERQMREHFLRSRSFRALQAQLKLTQYAAVGLIESLFLLAAENCPRGDIGRYTISDIAATIDWPINQVGELWRALVTSGICERHERYGMVIVEWELHAPDVVHARLARRGQCFWNGAVPKFTGLRRTRDRIKARAAYGIAADGVPTRSRDLQGSKP